MMNMEPNPPINPSGFMGIRHIQVTILTLGVICASMQKVVLGLGMVAMADSNDYNYPVIYYSTSQRGVLSSMFYYGYFVSSIPASMVVNKYGAAKMFAITCGLIGGLISCVTPLLIVYVGFESFCATRVLMGVSQGFLHPCIVSFLSQWVVPHEREKFSWTFCGTGIGHVVVNLVGGLLAVSPGGWPSLYYAPGILSLLWAYCCLKFTAEIPSEHKSISAEEKDYIQFYTKEHNSKKTTATNVPWLSIFKSVPVWALLIIMTANKWVDGVLINFLSTIFASVYNIEVELNGVLTMLTTLSQVAFTFVFSYIGNIFRSRFSANVSRKLWAFVGCVGMNGIFLIFALVDVEVTTAAILFCLATGLAGANYGLSTNPMDLSPNFSGNVFGFVASLSIVGSILSTSWVGNVVTDEKELSQWQNAILYGCIMGGVAYLIFLVFGSTSVQQWNEPKHHNIKNEHETTI